MNFNLSNSHYQPYLVQNELGDTKRGYQGSKLNNRREINSPGKSFVQQTFNECLLGATHCVMLG